MRRLAAIGVAGALGFCVGWWIEDARPAPAPPSAPPTVGPQRLQGYALARPLLECNAGTDRGSYAPLRGELEALVARARREARLGAIAINVRDLGSGVELLVDADLKFTPASLFKLPTVLSVLRAAELDPTLLDREIPVQPLTDGLRQEVAVESRLAPGRRYTVRHLVEQAIVHSDNEAAAALHEVTSVDRFMRIFTDLGLEPPKRGVREDFYTVREYAAFFRYLYNAGYLGPVMSEWALDLLARTRFRDGIVAGVPQTVEVAHKFGERRLETNPPGTRQQLHDCGIVYFPGRPYVLCVMTRGDSIRDLAGVIREVSAAVYRFHEWEARIATLAARP